jgi:predicted RNA-binding Zn ribbon-like protein
MDPLWADLINSDWHDHLGSGAREDRIGNDTWLARFLDRAGWDRDRLPDDQERQALRQLRTQLRSMVDQIRADTPVSNQDLEALNRVLAGSPVVRSLEQGASRPSLHLAPVAGGIKQVLGAVAASFAKMLVEGEAKRVKVCANPDCGWVIYDESRNRTRRWCDVSECGNLIKVRRHRQRKRQAERRPRSGGQG